MLKNKKQFIFILMLVLSLVLTVGCGNETEQNVDKQSDIVEQKPIQEQVDVEEEIVTEIETEEIVTEVETDDKQIAKENFDGYKIIEVDGGDTSGYRESNVAVDIGFGNREYWAFTNEYGQLVRVIAKEIILQDDKNEPVTSDGRYYSRMADVPGVGADTGYDRGHIIADSLGGVANAYNITPQNATLNRHGDQAYMEKVIRDAGGCTDFEAIITYPNRETQIPSKYKYTYTLKGNVIVDEFENINPEEYNKSIGITENKINKSNESNEIIGNNNNDVHILNVDTNGDGKVTIKEAKAAGFKMPITKEHWLYPYMNDADGDGQVGE